MALKIDTKFEGKLTCAFKNDIRNLASFRRLKNRYFILESKMAELNKNKNLHIFYKIVVLKRYKKISKKAVKLVFFSVQYTYFQDIMAASEKLT